MGSLILCLYSQQGGNELVIVQSQVWDFQEKSISLTCMTDPSISNSMDQLNN